jgi:TIR domain
LSARLALVLDRERIARMQRDTSLSRRIPPDCWREGLLIASNYVGSWLESGEPRRRAFRVGAPHIQLAYNTLMQKFRIFLSHITVESRLADLIKTHLVRDFIGLVEVFESSDRLSIPAGAKWLTEVMEGLKRADLHLILCSQDATSRPWIQFEAGAAHLREIPIVPLCHGGMTCAQLPVPLSEYEGIQASEPEGLLALYRTIATALGSSIPEIDFGAFAGEVESFEAAYTREKDLTTSKVPLERVVERIRDPKALCISSPQFTQLGFENQLQTVLNAFPAVVPHQRVFSSHELRVAVSGDQTYDIVHIAAFICPRSGTLYFTDVDLNTGESVVVEADFLNADALADLLQMVEAKLVVIGSCDSIALGATLVNVCHVIAARDMVSPKMMAAWVEAFYAKLPQRSLSEALDYALKVSQAPMRFYGRQVAKVDLLFMPGPAVTAIPA